MRISKETPAREDKLREGVSAQPRGSAQVGGGQDPPGCRGKPECMGLARLAGPGLKPGLTQKSVPRLQVTPTNSWPWRRALEEVWLRSGEVETPDHPGCRLGQGQRGDRQAGLGWEAWPGWTLSLCC